MRERKCDDARFYPERGRLRERQSFEMKEVIQKLITQHNNSLHYDKFKGICPKLSAYI